MATDVIHWWNDGELPLVGRGVDGLIYVVSTFLRTGTTVGCLGCARGPSLTDVLSAFARGVDEPEGPARWVSRDDFPTGSLRQGASAHKILAEAAVAQDAFLSV